MYKATINPITLLQNQPPAISAGKSLSGSLVPLPGNRSAQSALNRRNIGIFTRDVFKVATIFYSPCFKHSLYRYPRGSLIFSENMPDCGFKKCFPVDVPEPSLDHDHLSENAQDKQHEVERNAKMVVYMFALALFTGSALFLCSAPASASVAVSTASGTTATMDRSRILGMVGGAEVLASAWTGLMAGCLHTLTGPDHLAALAPLSIGRTKLESIAVGALWGCGHDAGQVLFGILFLLLKDRLHIEVLRTWGARVVGITLLAIGALGIKEAQEVTVPCLAGNNNSGTSTLQHADFNKSKVSLATFATGIIHGLQPDALLMVLPALALPSRIAGAAFLCMFLFGTVLAMGSYTAFIGSCSQAIRKRAPRITGRLSWCSAIIAIFIGAAILLNEQFGRSLF